MSEAESMHVATAPALFAAAMEYATDAAQRSILFWDVMRQRAEQYREHVAHPTPHVLDYKVELLCDGRSLPKPVNYLLVKILPPDDAVINPVGRPFVIVDPRAGHGPGIGGFKAESEIGVAMKAGHPCYFIGFLPDPMPGQTIADIAQAEATFLEIVTALHPQADGKPCVIGNCQAGWAVMMLAAMRPELFGPIILAGSPLSYWNGVLGRYPMRYAGGLLGGSWLATLTSDLGGGKFDGAWLVQNFENQNPANTWWAKQYNLFSKIDTEAPRYLGFEKWWGGHVSLNAEEIQFIVDELFVGNNLAAGKIQLSDGTAVDLRNIRSPIVVFCSEGDNITPPQQALGWILDLYDSVDDICAFGQTIVYTVHESVGHLGIFVSSGVARKEHGEFSSNIDLIDTLPPGLYEATFQPRDSVASGAELASGNWVMRCEERSLDDIRALGGNSAEDDRRFAAAARVSEINLALYRTFAQPFVKAMVNPVTVEVLQRFHPLRLQYEMFSNANPLMAMLPGLAEQVRKDRRPVASNNPFLAIQENFSDEMIKLLDRMRQGIEQTSERLFLTLYGLPTLQTAVGIDPHSDQRLRHVAKDPLHSQLQQQRIAELRANMNQGGLPAATIRSLLFAALERGAIDERGFEALKRIREAHTDMALPEFKTMVREQSLMLLIDTDAALAAIPAMLPENVDQRTTAIGFIRQVLGAQGALSDADQQRLKRVEELFSRPANAQRGA